MTARRRRNLFPGVPAPGGPDVDATHSYPGLAAELRDEPAEVRQTIRDYEPEGAEPIDEQQSMPDLLDALQQSVDRARADTSDLPPSERHDPAMSEVWGGDRPGVGHLGLADRSADVPPADVDEWRRTVLDREAESSDQRDARLGQDHRPPEAERATLPGWSSIEAPQGIEQPQGPEAISDGTAPEGDEAEPGYALTSEDGSGVTVSLPCGCRFTLHPCSL